METRRLVLTLTGIGVVLIVVLGGLSIALLATGGGNDSSSAQNGSQTSPAATAQLPQRVAGELRLFGGDPISLDPACASDADSAAYIVELFSGLVSFDKNLKVIPDVAESWDTSGDGKVYTFHLRKNVEFHDGSRRVVADDFKFSMERAVNPDTQSTVGVMYENDEIDISGVGVNDVERIRDPNEPLNKEYRTGANMSTDYIGFNTQEGPFNDHRVRKAFAMATDRDLVAKTVLMDILLPAKGVLPPGMPGYDQNLAGIPYDPEGAKALLEEAGGPDILKDVTLLTSGQGAAPSDALAAVTALWKQNLGVDIQIEQEELGIFLRDIDRGNFKMFSLGWIADYPDPQNFLEIKLHSQSPDNETKYSNPEVDKLLDSARTETDQAKRTSDYQEAEKIIVDDAPWVPLFYGQDSVLVKPYVKNFVNAPFVIPRMRYVTIER